MKNRIKIQRQSDKVSPFRLKLGGLTVSLFSFDQAKRVREFIIKYEEIQNACRKD